MNEKTLTMVSLAMLVDSVLFGVVLVILQISGVKHPFEFSGTFYAVLIPAFAVVLSINYVKDLIWRRAQEEGVRTSTQFYKTLFTATIVSFALLDTIGTLGLAIFFLTGNLYLSAFLIALSALAKIFQFPTNNSILLKKKEFPFCTHDANNH